LGGRPGRLVAKVEPGCDPAMDQGGENDARRRPAGADRGNNAPPPSPEDDEANGGGRQIGRPRRRVRARALVVMVAAGAYILLAEALSGAPPSAAWMLTSFVLWLVGKALLLLSFIN